jgi:hypothetical protein
MISLPLAELLAFSNEFKPFFGSRPIELVGSDPSSVCVPNQNETGYTIGYTGNGPDGWMVLKNSKGDCVLLEIKDGVWKAYFPRDEERILHRMATMLETPLASRAAAWNRLRFLMRIAHTEAHKEKRNLNYLSDFLVDAYLSMNPCRFIEDRAKAG